MWKSQRSIPMAQRDTIYRDVEGGVMVYFTYSDGQKVKLSRAYSENEVGRGYARYVDLER